MTSQGQSAGPVDGCRGGRPHAAAVCAYITGHRPLALPLGELSPQVTERAGMVMVCPLRPRCARPPLPKGEARDAHTAHQNVCRGGALPRPEYDAKTAGRCGHRPLRNDRRKNVRRGGALPRPEVTIPPSWPKAMTPPFAQGRCMGFPLSLLLFQLCQHTGKFLRQGTGKLHWLVGAGVEEAQAGGVEALAGQAGDGLFRAVDRVA